jgi:putative ABC transport system ATP-binding protein
LKVQLTGNSHIEALTLRPILIGSTLSEEVPVIKITNVRKIYQSGKMQIEALKGVSFEVQPGDFIVIKGPSGSGKSTLLNILGLLDEPTSGEVRLNNERVQYSDFDLLAEQRARYISFIFQSFNLNPVLTLEENVMVPLMIRNDISKAEKQKRVLDWIDKVGLTSHKLHRPDELSGGQRQRVAIARAMVSKPRLVIADEPTANLDSTTTKSIISLMQELNLEEKVAFVFATHDPTVQQFAKKTWILTDGDLTC